MQALVVGHVVVVLVVYFVVVAVVDAVQVQQPTAATSGGTGRA